MDKIIINFGNIEIEQFHQHKSQILINNIDINKIVIFNKVFFGKKKF